MRRSRGSALLHKIDIAIFIALNRGDANSAFDWLMPRLTNLDHYRWFQVAALALIVVVLGKGGKWGRVWVLCTLLAVGLSDFTASHVIKAVLHRERPCYRSGVSGPFAFPDTRLLGQCPGSYSFPSNHASNMMAMGLTCWWFTRRRTGRGGEPGKGRRWDWALLWFLVPLIIGYTRPYLGVHYPSDVLGGWVLGALVSATVIRFVARPLLADRR